MLRRHDYRLRRYAKRTYLSVINQDLEEGVHKQDAVWLNGGSVQKHRLGRATKRVRV